MNLETHILKQRVYCESPGCMAEANVCRELYGGHFRVTCWQHDPDTQQSFSAWLDQQGDSLPQPTSFNEYLTRREDSI